MTSTTTVVHLRQPDEIDDPLTAVLRGGARRLLAQAIEAEAEAFLALMSSERLADGRERVVRHGHGPERLVQTGIGPVAVQRVKLRDRAAGEAGAGRIRFTSAIRERRKARGEIGADKVSYKAIDQRGETYALPVAAGDRVRLFRSTWARIDGRGGWIGNNGNVVEVAGRTDAGLRLRDKDGRVGDVEWRRLSDPKTGRLLLGFGDALTIDAAQGITSGEHIAAFPRGTAGVTGFKAYVAESRAKGATWTMIAEGALHEAVKRSRALGDASPVKESDLWDRVAADLAHKPYRALGVDLIRKSRDYLAEAVDAFIRQSHRFQVIEAEGRDPGLEVRKQVQARAADKAVARNGTALGGMLRQNGAALREVGQEAASLERGGRVRAFVRQLGEPRQPGERGSDEVRRQVQAEAGRRTIAPHAARLVAGVQRNADILKGLSQDIDAHVRKARAGREEVRSRVEKVARKPFSSPSSGM